MTRHVLVTVILLLLALPLAAQSDLQAAIQTIVDNAADPNGPALVMIVSTEDQQITAATGFADIENQIPVQVDDRFRIGSITKTFVAVLALQLAEEGKLSLDDPLSDWLEGDLIDRVPNADELTLRHLLNMTSGIPDYLAEDAFFDAVDEYPDYPWTAAETVAYVYDLEPLFAPGESFDYSNTNYNLMQLVIEEAAAEPLADVLAAYIFEPAGMVNSYLEDPATLGQGIVQGYSLEYDEDTLANVTLINDGMGLADGGIISTVDDMRRFGEALLYGDLISEQSLEDMMAVTPQSDDEYGLGFEVMSGSDGGLIVGHSGASGGFQSILYIYIDYGVLVAAVTNDFTAETIDMELAEAAVEAVLQD